MGHDLRYGLRMLRRTPGFTAIAIVSLALGIGANTAIFSLVNSVMLRMLPVREPAQLVELLHTYPGEPRLNGFSWQSYENFRDHNQVLAGLMGLDPARVVVRGETLDGEYVTGTYFPLLGVKPVIGRFISPEDDSGVAVLSWSYWKTRFNLDPAILNKSLIVQDARVTIVGVAPRDFTGLQVASRTDLWLPLALQPMNRRGRMALIGRLKPGVSIQQARAELTVLFQFTLDELAKTNQDPLMHQLRFEMAPAGAGLSLLRDQFEKPLLLLMSVVGVLLLLACTNVASLLLARGATRHREIAVRVALGAGRFRLVRQVLTEALLLSAAGSLLGIVLAYFGAGALVRILASGRQIPGLPAHLNIQIRPDAHVLLFTVAVAVLTGVLFGMAPAWSAFAAVPATSLREMGKASETKSRRLFGKSLVVAQVALSVVLLSAAALFVRHLTNLKHLDLGFRSDHLLLVTLSPSQSGYSRERLTIAYRELLDRLNTLPGVRSATMTAVSPISGAGISRFATVEGFTERPEDRRYNSINLVAPRFFETFGTPLLAGREFTFQDQGRSRVAIVNQALTQHFFGGSNPIGKHLTIDGDDKPYEIVGVVGNAKYYEIREPSPRTIYFDMFQEQRISSRFALRTNVDPAAVASQVRITVRESLPPVPVSAITTMDDQVDASIVPERLIAVLSGLFGALGTLLAAIGLYGLLAYTVARRINEIGVRMALGATPGIVNRMVIREALAMVFAGLAIGTPLAFWSRRLAASLIEGLPVASVLPIAFGAVAMVAVAVVAGYVPARRAASVDPMEALRQE